MVNLKTIDDLWKESLRQGFRVIRKKGVVDYDWARSISNSHFDYYPEAVAFPKTAEHVSFCLLFCKQNRIPFRIRSGGHHHAGMSSLDGGLVIRLSEMNQITYPDTDYQKAWIPTGKALQEVYDELQLLNKSIAAGSCYSVNIGGLALGGGWGMTARRLGLTCDNFEEVEMVLADGKIVRVRADNEYQDLFWALRGGGGGNFGIVTKFLFKLHPIGDYVSTVLLQWKTLGDREQAMIQWYLDSFDKLPSTLTTSLHLKVQHTDMQQIKNGKVISNYYPLNLIGKFYGRKKELQTILKDFLHDFEPDIIDIQEHPMRLSLAPIRIPKDRTTLLSNLLDSFASAPIKTPPKIPALPNSNKHPYKKLPPPALEETCLDSYPHKVSSGFPISKDCHADLAKTMIEIIKQSNSQQLDGGFLYMILHSMPGSKAGIKATDSAFYYRDKNIMLQLQSWWRMPQFTGRAGEVDTDYNSYKFKAEWEAYIQDQAKYIQWVDTSRTTLSPYLEGAFINFPDPRLPLETYYGGNFERIRAIKHKYDPQNLFRFPMSIPPAVPKSSSKE